MNRVASSSRAALCPDVFMAIGIRGGGAAACLAPPARRIRGGAATAALLAAPLPLERIRAGCASAAPLTARSAATVASTRGPVPFLRCCLPDPLREEESNREAWEALKAMIAGIFRPLFRNLAEIKSLRTVYDLEDYHLGILLGAVLGCVGCHQLWKAAPSIFIDVVLGYAFYRLSVVSSEVRRQGKRNNLFTRLQFGIVVIMAIKDFRKNYEFLDILRMPAFALYYATFLFDITGLKKYARHYLILTVNLLRTKGGFQELFRIIFYPGYVSPHDDCFHRKEDTVVEYMEEERSRPI
ncbi:hypothetical protein ACP70R_007091 [Stipagrostis hirtigluma subsp. patula]